MAPTRIRNADRTVAAVHRAWVDGLATRDKELHDELTEFEASIRADRRRDLGAAPATTADDEAAAVFKLITFGRPAVPVQDGKLGTGGPAADAASTVMIQRLRNAALVIEPSLPFAGRLDIGNAALGGPFIGTGWLVAPNIVVTNAHVANRVARAVEGGGFQFHVGTSGGPITLAVDTAHEFDRTTLRSVNIRQVLWIEPDPDQLDIAFLEVDANGILTTPIPLSTVPAKENDPVVVVGYPASERFLSPAEQARRDKVFRGLFDRKCACPGMVDKPLGAMMRHDCSTLDGNSGSVVLSMTTGAAVGLHVSGEDHIDNLAIPASAVAALLQAAPWKS